MKRNHSAKTFKPSPDAYALVEAKLGVPPSEVLFVSSNPWDACGAKAFGFNVAWIERVTPEAMALACVRSDLFAPLTLFKALRTQMDELGVEPDHRIRTLSELPRPGRRPMSLESVRAFFARESSRYHRDGLAGQFGDGSAGGASLWRRARTDRENAELADRRDAWC